MFWAALAWADAMVSETVVEQVVAYGQERGMLDRALMQCVPRRLLHSPQFSIRLAERNLTDYERGLTGVSEEAGVRGGSRCAGAPA